MIDYKILKKIYTKEECQKFINNFELYLDEEFDFDDYKCGRYDFRNNKLSEEIYNRIKDLLLPIDNSICGMSNKFYISKYWPNTSSISEHIDGNIQCDRLMSKYSAILYLNDNF